MPWFCASAAVLTQTKAQQESREVLVEENVYLVYADDEEEAFIKAADIAQNEIVEDPTLRIDDEPAEQKFLGIRKLIKISNPPTQDLDNDPPVHGCELFYSKFTMSASDIDKFVNGDSVQVVYEE